MNTQKGLPSSTQSETALIEWISCVEDKETVTKGTSLCVCEECLVQMVKHVPWTEKLEFIDAAGRIGEVISRQNVQYWIIKVLYVLYGIVFMRF